MIIKNYEIEKNINLLDKYNLILFLGKIWVLKTKLKIKLKIKKKILKK